MRNMDTDYGAKARKTAQNYDNYRHGVQFRYNNIEDESDFCSPPLWRTSPSRNPVENDDRRSLRVDAIARGQKELMEMVKNMPESSYELSLKDIVEQPRIIEKEKKMVENGIVKRQESKKGNNMVRSGSMDNRMVALKMGFPVSFGGKKKKNKGTNIYTKVSPKPEGGSDKSSKGVDDWWKKRFSGSNNESSSGSSSRSNSNRKMSPCLPNFWPLVQLKKKISAN